MKLQLPLLILASLLIIACSQKEKAAAVDPTFEIAKTQREELTKTKAMAAEMEQQAAEENQKIDAQTQ